MTNQLTPEQIVELLRYCELRTAVPGRLYSTALLQLQVQAAELERLRDAISREEHDMQQTLGKALGYPPLYPGASDVDDGSICVGDNVAASLAVEAAWKIVEQAAELERLREVIGKECCQCRFENGELWQECHWHQCERFVTENGDPTEVTWQARAEQAEALATRLAAAMKIIHDVAEEVMRTDEWVSLWFTVEAESNAALAEAAKLLK